MNAVRKYERLLYNGTTVQAALSIEEEGLRPGTYLTPSKESAVRYALARAELEGAEPAVVSVKVPSSLLCSDPIERDSFVSVKHVPVEYVIGWESIREQ